MAEVDRPDGKRGVDPATEAPARRPATGAAAAPLRVYRGGRVRRSGLARPVLPGDIGARLASLEGRVEEALGRTGLAERFGGERIRAAVDGVLATLASVRRLAVSETGSGGRPRPLDDPANLAAAVLRAVYRYWWRVDALGLERVPAEGRVILAVNRSGALLPYEALMVATALALEQGGRAARPLVDDWLLRLPAVGPSLARAGALSSTPANARRLLEHDDAVVVYPEGAHALAKPFRRRYRLERFGRGTFAQVAIETGAPIVPAAVIGAEEVHPVLGRVDGAGRLLGLPTLPLTPTFPWLGLAGLVPLPTKWTVHFGEPLDVRARHDPADGVRAEAVGAVSDQVRERLQALVLEGLRRRHSLFRAS
jgi:1-acyl-sn-glycerol-3-phosphate acyltransferase